MITPIITGNGLRLKSHRVYEHIHSNIGAGINLAIHCKSNDDDLIITFDIIYQKQEIMRSQKNSSF